MCSSIDFSKTLEEFTKMEPGQESRFQSGTVLRDRVSCCGAGSQPWNPPHTLLQSPIHPSLSHPATYNLAWSRLTPVKNSHGSQTPVAHSPLEMTAFPTPSTMYANCSQWNISSNHLEKAHCASLWTQQEALHGEKGSTAALIPTAAAPKVYVTRVFKRKKKRKKERKCYLKRNSLKVTVWGPETQQGECSPHLWVGARAAGRSRESTKNTPQLPTRTQMLITSPSIWTA